MLDSMVSWAFGPRGGFHWCYTVRRVAMATAKATREVAGETLEPSELVASCCSSWRMQPVFSVSSVGQTTRLKCTLRKVRRVLSLVL